MIPARRLLVVNADDFGLTPGLSRAVVRAHRDGIVTSTSVLAVSRAFDVAAALVRGTPSLGLGAHLALVGEDPPLLTPREVPTLVDRSGGFPLSYRTVVRRLALRRVDTEDIRRELAAQLDRVISIGVPVTHVDSHQHLHLWPSVGRIVLELAQERGIPVVRRPRSRRHFGVGLAVNLLSSYLGRCIRESSLMAPDDYAGLDEAGGMDAATLQGAVEMLAAAAAETAEINVHPGEVDDPELGRFTWGYRWGDEYAALVQPALRSHIERLGYRLGSFADLAGMDRS